MRIDSTQKLPEAAGQVMCLSLDIEQAGHAESLQIRILCTETLCQSNDYPAQLHSWD